MDCSLGIGPRGVYRDSVPRRNTGLAGGPAGTNPRPFPRGTLFAQVPPGASPKRSRTAVWGSVHEAFIANPFPGGTPAGRQPGSVSPGPSARAWARTPRPAAGRRDRRSQAGLRLGRGRSVHSRDDVHLGRSATDRGSRPRLRAQGCRGRAVPGGPPAVAGIPRALGAHAQWGADGLAHEQLPRLAAMGRGGPRRGVSGWRGVVNSCSSTRTPSSSLKSWPAATASRSGNTLSASQADTEAIRVVASGDRLAGGMRKAVDRVSLPWHLHRLDPRARYTFHSTPVRNAEEAWACQDDLLTRPIRVWLSDRGVWEAIIGAGPVALGAGHGRGRRCLPGGLVGAARRARPLIGVRPADRGP